jgi:galactokinase
LTAVRAWAPGRVNLIGGHSDYTGGLVLPMAIDLGTTVTGELGGTEVVLISPLSPEPAVVPLDVSDPAAVTPGWARYVAGVVAELQPAAGLQGQVTSTLPVGAGLSSSAALEVAVALALGFEGTPLELAQVCQRAEQRASGVPCGIMDQLASAAGVEGHALRIDCTALTVASIPVPDDVEVVVVDSGQRRELATSAYAERAAACQAAAQEIGPLADATLADVERIADGTVRRRARHVVTENARVDRFCDAVRSGDRAAMSDLMAASHASLHDDFEVSTPALDALVAELVALDGVVGARLTGAGFGGCVVTIVERGTQVPLANPQWRVQASVGASSF